MNLKHADNASEIGRKDLLLFDWIIRHGLWHHVGRWDGVSISSHSDLVGRRKREPRHQSAVPDIDSISLMIRRGFPKSTPSGSEIVTDDADRLCDFVVVVVIIQPEKTVTATIGFDEIFVL